MFEVLGSPSSSRRPRLETTAIPGSDYQLWALIHQVDRATYKVRENEVKSLGISPMQAGIMFILSQSEKPVPLWDMLKLIQKTAATNGPENVNAQTIYDTATTFQLDTDGGQHVAFTETKRTAYDYLGMYRASATDQTSVRMADD